MESRAREVAQWRCGVFISRTRNKNDARGNKGAVFQFQRVQGMDNGMVECGTSWVTRDNQHATTRDEELRSFK